MIHHDAFDDETRAYVRRVSRSLARGDVHLADDLEQETLVAALKGGPRDRGALRGWLRAVTLNCLRAHRNRSARRPRNVYLEEGQHAGESHDPAELYERTRVRETIERRLAGLSPDVAATIRMRVLDGLPPRVVARELNVPVETVRTRTRRGLARLREETEREIGPTILRPRRPMLTLAPLFLRRSFVAAAVVLCAGLGLFGLFRAQGDERTEQGTTLRTAEASALADGLLGAPERVPATRIAVPAEPEILPAAVPAPAPPRATPPFHGAVEFQVRVTDPSGRTIEDAEIYVRRGLLGHVRLAGSTDRDGHSTIFAIPTMRLIAARGPAGWVSRALVVEQPSAMNDGTIDLVLEPCPVAWFHVRGRTPRPADDPFEVWCEPERLDVLSQVDPETGASGAPLWLPAWRDAAGRYGVTWNDHTKRILVRGDTAEAPWRSRPYDPFEEPPRALEVGASWVLRGRVVTATGRPVDDAVVTAHALDREGTLLGNDVSRETGQFSLDSLDADVVELRFDGVAIDEVHRPLNGANEADRGDLQLPGTHLGSALRAHVVLPPNGPAVARVLALEERERELWAGHGFVVPRARTVKSRPDTHAEELPGVLPVVFERPRPEISAVLVRFEDESLPPTLALRPEGGWGTEPVRIVARPSAAGRLTATSARENGTLRIRYTHAETGYAFLLEDFDPWTEDRTEPGRVQSPLLPDGVWNVVVATEPGRILERNNVRVRGGETVDLGDLGQEPESRSPIDWSRALAVGSAQDRVLVTVARGGRILLERAGERSMLSGLGWSERRFDPGTYTVTVADATGHLTWTVELPAPR